MKCCKVYKNCGTELIDFKNSVLSSSDEITTMASVQENLWKRYIFHVTFDNLFQPGCTIEKLSDLKKKCPSNGWGGKDCSILDMDLETKIDLIPNIYDKIMKTILEFTKYNIIIHDMYSVDENLEEIISEYNNEQDNKNNIEGVVHIKFDDTPSTASMSTKGIGRQTKHVKRYLDTYDGSNYNSRHEDNGFYMISKYNRKFEISLDDGMWIEIDIIPVEISSYRFFIKDGFNYEKEFDNFKIEIKLVYEEYLSINEGQFNFQIDIACKNNIENIKIKIAKDNKTFGYISGQIIEMLTLDGIKFNESAPNLYCMYENTITINEFSVSSLLHEFCHVLGFVHTHQIYKNNPIMWNRDNILKFYDNNMVRAVSNVFSRIINMSIEDYDEESIMTYTYKCRENQISLYNGKPYDEQLKDRYKFSKKDIAALNYLTNGLRIPRENYGFNRNKLSLTNGFLESIFKFNMSRCSIISIIFISILILFIVIIL